VKYLAPGVWRLKEVPAPTINVYLAEDVLIDAGRRWDRGRIFSELQGVEISMVALTHVHPDHQGVAKDVCQARGVPLACHADDVAAMEGTRPVQEAQAENPINKVIRALWQGPPYKVERVLAEGDEVAGFRVIHFPGHAPGLIGLWRERDRVVLVSDTVYLVDSGRLKPLPEGEASVPHPAWAWDHEQAKASVRKLAALDPAVVGAGHEAPLRGESLRATLEQAAEKH